MRLVFDTNVILDFLKKKPDAVDLPALNETRDCFVSVITKLELLKKSTITAKEEADILTFLSTVPVLPLDFDIENETIAISRATKLKLPDAIIAATACVFGAEVVTRDVDFLSCAYPALRIWQE